MKTLVFCENKQLRKNCLLTDKNINLLLKVNLKKEDKFKVKIKFL